MLNGSDQLYCDAVLATVKEWPGSTEACFEASATAILDGVGARRQGLRQVGTKKRRAPVEPRNELEDWRGGCAGEIAGTSIGDSA